jgi:hypothetical protein
MVTENMEDVFAKQPTSYWVIDLDWYEQNRRSFIESARRSLCSKCNEKLQKKKKKVTLDDVLGSIIDCCAKTPDYITRKTPVMDSIFRILLANGNQPLDVEDMGKQLSERRGDNTYTALPHILTRLLTNDHWYGFKQVSKK